MARGRNAWVKAHERDAFVRRARRDGYRSRAAYKLAALDRSHRLLRPGQLVVDLGAAPGGWSQYARERVGAGRVIAVDLLAMAPIDGVEFLQGDFTDPATVEAVRARAGSTAPDLVICDMAPNMSGVAARDQAASAALAIAALEFSHAVLKPRGVVVVKVFEGEEVGHVRERCRQLFAQCASTKPEASRSRSAEFYLVGRGTRPARVESGEAGAG